MLIIYDSLTGQGKKYAEKVAEKLGATVMPIHQYLGGNEKLFLISRCYNFGEVPETTLDFLDELRDTNNLTQLIGVSITGNQNWGENFGKAGYTIEKEYGIKYVHRFEFAGTHRDVEATVNYIKNTQ